MRIARSDDQQDAKFRKVGKFRCSIEYMCIDLFVLYGFALNILTIVVPSCLLSTLSFFNPTTPPLWRPPLSISPMGRRGLLLQSLLVSLSNRMNSIYTVLPSLPDGRLSSKPKMSLTPHRKTSMATMMTTYHETSMFADIGCLHYMETISSFLPSQIQVIPILNPPLLRPVKSP